MSAAKTSGVQPTGTSGRLGGKPKNRSSGPGPGAGRESGQQNPGDSQSKKKMDIASFTELVQDRLGTGETGQQPGDQELDRILNIADDSNEHIRQMVRDAQEAAPETKAVPSVLGLPLDIARQKMKLADFKVQSVAREYHASLPVGRVAAQEPVPGTLALRRAGVKLVLSKGPAPSRRKEPTKEELRRQDGFEHARSDMEGARPDGLPDPKLLSRNMEKLLSKHPDLKLPEIPDLMSLEDSTEAAGEEDGETAALSGDAL